MWLMSHTMLKCKCSFVCFRQIVCDIYLLTICRQFFLLNLNYYNLPCLIFMIAGKHFCLKYDKISWLCLYYQYIRYINLHLKRERLFTVLFFSNTVFTFLIIMNIFAIIISYNFLKKIKAKTYSFVYDLLVF